MYPAMFKDDYPNLKDVELKAMAKNLRDGKIQNVAITIDKVMHILQTLNTTEPPIRGLSPKECFQRLWLGEKSLKASLTKVLQQMEPCEEVSMCFDFMDLIETANCTADSLDANQTDESAKEYEAEIYSDLFAQVRHNLDFMQ